MTERILPGGYFYDNIRNWIINECAQADDPELFFENILVVLEDLDEDRGWLEEDDGFYNSEDE